MKQILLLSALVIALAGCGQSEEPVTTTTSEGDVTQPTTSDDSGEAVAPTPPSSEPVAIPEQDTAEDQSATTAATEKPDTDALTRRLRGWMMANRTGLPKSFEAWIAASGIQVPPPPPGKKYVITPRAWVTLEDK